jgi:hypothetical protein
MKNFGARGFTKIPSYASVAVTDDMVYVMVKNTEINVEVVRRVK